MSFIGGLARKDCYYVTITVQRLDWGAALRLAFTADGTRAHFRAETQMTWRESPDGRVPM